MNRALARNEATVFRAPMGLLVVAGTTVWAMAVLEAVIAADASRVAE